MLVRWLGILALLGGCYSPKLGDCAVACGKGDSCPPGLRCDNAVCRLPEMVGTACTEPEIQQDADPTVDINPETCTFGLVSTNFAPADVAETSPPAWDVLVTPDEPFMTGGVDGHAVSQTDAAPLWIVHKSRFTVAAGATLTIEGNHALIIAADDIDIAGTIIVNNGPPDATCDAAEGAVLCNNAGGGGGGGYGGVGGDGGGPPSANGGSVSGVNTTPLRAGCPGAAGGPGTKVGDLSPLPGGVGGAAGGALQLTGRKSVHISGQILANGRAGHQGTSDAAGSNNCPGFTGRGSGGGGGGAGGTIFIESCAVVIEPSAKLCANGGSGGGGGGGGNSNTGYIGHDGSCDAQAPGGAGEVTPDDDGGAGGYDGLPAGAGGYAKRAGGGGGGAVGRIHIYQVAGMPTTTGATIKPPANRSQ